MRTLFWLVVLVLGLLVAACAPHPAPPAALAAPVVPVIASDTASGMSAVYTPGTRNVRVLIVRPPSIVLLREVFVPAGEAITAVRWSDSGLIVDTADERFALDTRTWKLASRAAFSQHLTAGARGRRRG